MLAKVSIAASWPKTTSFRSRSRVCSCSLSELDTLRGGILAILATIFSMSFGPIDLRRLSSGWIFTAAPISSITSIALSGQFAVVDMLGGKLDRGANGAGAVVHAVMFFVVRL